MDIKWKCDGCGQPAVTDSQYAGAEVECPNCKKSLTVPNSEPLQEQKSEKPKPKPGTKCRIHDHKVAFFTCAKCGQPACEMCLAAVDNYTYCQTCFTEQKAMKKEKAPEPPAPRDISKVSGPFASRTPDSVQTRANQQGERQQSGKWWQRKLCNFDFSSDEFRTGSWLGGAIGVAINLILQLTHVSVSMFDAAGITAVSVVLGGIGWYLICQIWRDRK